MRGEDPSNLIGEEQSTGIPTMKAEEFQCPAEATKVAGAAVKRSLPLWRDVENAGFGSAWRRGRERNNSLLVPTELIRALHNGAWHKEKEGINQNKIL